MASKTISTILNLKDNMSPKLFKVSKNVASLTKEEQRATKFATNMANKFNSSVNQMSIKAVKFAAVGATMAGAFALKTGLSEAIDLEGYRTQLETATKDTKKAAKIMKYAITLANATPFEGGELVEGASKLEAMGMSAEEWLPKIGDMAAATNKPFDQAIEAVIDAQTGELERMKEFGVTKAKIAEKANKMFAGQEVVNSKGQITDQKKFNQAMVAIMKDRFVGGMEKQSKTVKGLWSTITGVTKSALSTIVGMQSDGTIKAGSMLATLKVKLTNLADKFAKWQSDGTIDKLGKKFSDAFGKLDGLLKSVKDHFGEIKVALEVLAGVWVAQATVNAAYNAVLFFTKLRLIGAVTWLGLTKLALIAQSTWLGIVTAAQWLFNAAMTANPIGLIILGLYALGGVIYLVVKHWKDIVTWIKKAWDWLTKWNGTKAKDKNVTLTTTHKNAVKNPQITAGSLGRNALGTSYWRGGLTSINERGGEIVDLPSGSKVIPADKSKKITNNKSNNVFNININAINKSTGEIMNELMPQLKLKLSNL